jgi:hypothetical protein
MPLVSAGNFACVFKMQAAPSAFAIRCFTRPVTDQQHRYEMLSDHLKRYSSPYLVEFEYIADGIRVQANNYPILKMDWASGEQLNSFVEDHLSESEVLQRLAAKWRGLVSSLHGAFMAHGDLQHGNVIVDSSQEMHLVDYDAMFISTLSGKESLEIGHPNYQHPRRSKINFDTSVDNFAALVIYLSLRALAVDPGLWERGAVDKLILTSDDYRNPKQSQCFRRLEISPDADVARLALVLEGCCSGSPSKVPYLEDHLQGQQTRQPSVSSRRSPTREQPKAALPQRQMVKCPKGHENEPAMVVCQHRGCQRDIDPRQKQCHKCQKLVNIKASFCTECGCEQAAP